MKRSRIKEMLIYPIRIIIGVPKAFVASYSNSYYPEEKRKKLFVRVVDNFSWLLRYREANRFYNLYGFDLVNGNENEKEYIDYLSFAHERDEKNLIREVNSQVVLLRDKLLFYKYMNSNSMPVPEVFAILLNNTLYDMDMNPVSEDFLLDKSNYFVKELNGECASFVRHINGYRDYLNEKNEIVRHNCIFQKTITQHPKMDIINPNALNTLRIVTVYNNGKPYVLSVLLRVGTKATGNVDNWAKGGLAIGINDNGYLKKYGYYKPHFGTKADVHPDTGINFSDFEIPQFHIACETACQAHRFFYNIETIGWDVAISTEGPIFIEGNDNWEISLQQVVDNGLRKKWTDAMNSYNAMQK